MEGSSAKHLIYSEFPKPSTGSTHVYSLLRTMKFTAVLFFLAACSAEHHHRRDGTDYGINLASISSALYIPTLVSSLASNPL
jgi:hypothetical protein